MAAEERHHAEVQHAYRELLHMEDWSGSSRDRFLGVQPNTAFEQKLKQVCFVYALLCDGHPPLSSGVLGARTKSDWTYFFVFANIPTGALCKEYTGPLLCIWLCQVRVKADKTRTRLKKEKKRRELARAYGKAS